MQDQEKVALGVGAVVAGGALWALTRSAASHPVLSGTVCCFDVQGQRQVCPADLALTLVGPAGTVVVPIDRSCDPAAFSVRVAAGHYSVRGQGQEITTVDLAAGAHLTLPLSVTVRAWQNA